MNGFIRIASALVIASAIAAPAHAVVTGTLAIPPRPANALTGTQFFESVRTASDAAREQAIVNEIATGNVPDFMRALKTVTITSGGHSISYNVLPDYLAIGSNADYFRMPMSAPLAQQIVVLMDCHLPTRKMSNDIWAASEVKLAPYPFSPATYDIDSIETMWLSNQAIENQLGGRTPGSLIAGNKKDVVVTPQIDQRPAPPRVAIFGWHYQSGTPIQPLSLVHEASYEDYSHGIRAVEEACMLDGAESSISAVLANPTVAYLLSDEGAFTTVYPVPNPYPVPGENDELVKNGGFELGFTGGAGNFWTSWTAAGSSPVVFGEASVNRYEGAHSQYWARTDTAAMDSGVYQTITVEPGARYEILAWMKRQSTFGDTAMEFGYDLTGGTVGNAASVVYGNITGTTDNVWVSYRSEARATGTSLTFFARGRHTSTTGGANAYFYLDAVSMKQIESNDSPDAFVIY